MKLLIVEDDYITLEGIIKVIKWNEIGITKLEKADDGLNALKIAQQFHPDIVLSDIRMPRMDGITFASKLLDLDPNCKIIFMSAYSDREYYKEAIKLQAINFIEKPIDVSELESAIIDAISLCRKEKARSNHTKEVYQTLHSSFPFIKSELSLLLINKNLHHEEIKKMMKLLSLNVEEDADFVTSIVKTKDALFEEFSHDNKVHSIIISKIEDTISQYGLNAIVAFKDDRHILLHIYESPDKKHLVSLENIEKLNKAIYQSFEDEIFVSIVTGKVVKGIENIYESYNTALTAQHKLFYQKTQIGQYRFTDNRKPYLFDNNIIEEFSNYLARKDSKNLVLLIRRLSNVLREHPSTLINTVKAFYFQLMMKLYKLAEVEELQLFESNICEGLLWDIVESHGYLSDLEELLISKIEIYFTLLEEKNKYSATVSTILEYIHTHYHKNTLSTKEISENLYLSSAYICVIFKQETGETINKYITKFRINISKKMLKDPSLKIAEIARNVGYTEGDYFAKVFKKHEGLSPSEYRKGL